MYPFCSLVYDDTLDDTKAEAFRNSDAADSYNFQISIPSYQDQILPEEVINKSILEI